MFQKICVDMPQLQSRFGFDLIIFEEKEESTKKTQSVFR